jgi:hypothetical protein
VKTGIFGMVSGSASRRDPPSPALHWIAGRADWRCNVRGGVPFISKRNNWRRSVRRIKFKIQKALKRPCIKAFSFY